MFSRLVACASVTGLLAASPALAAAPVVISQPRDAISDLFLDRDSGEVSWTWRDDGEEGSSALAPGGTEATRPPGLVAPGAFSHDGTLSVLRDGRRVTVARDRTRVSDEHFVTSPRRIFAWVERHRSLYARVESDATGRFGTIQRLAGGGIRAVDLDDARMLVWQDGRNRIRARERVGVRWRPAVTIATTSTRVGELRTTIDRYRQRRIVIWSTASGVRAATSPRGGPYGPPVKLSSAPASGIVSSAVGELAWGEPGRIRVVAYCDDGFHRRTRTVTGTPHLDGITLARQVVYTLDGGTYFEDERLGDGHDARVLAHDVVWIDGSRVRQVTPDTPEATATDACSEM